MEFDGLSNRVIGCAIEVHRHLGPGLLESAYRRCLAYELQASALSFETERSMPVHYKGADLECGFRMDLVVENQLLVELKAVDRLLPIHDAQVLTYLRMAKLKVGLLINFHTRILGDGIRRFVL
jgi:GxxExxY protein